MTIGLVGKKQGMTRLFTQEGNSYPVSVVTVKPNTVTQIKDVVVGTPNSDSVFLQYPKARPTFTGIRDTNFGSLDHVHVATGFCRDTRKLLYPIKCASFDGKESRGPRLYFQQCRAGCNFISVANRVLNFSGFI